MMMPRFDIAPLSTDRIDQAYPIVQSVMPRMDVATWRDHARRLTGAGAARPCGILTAEFGGYIYGLCSYRIDSHLLHGRVLVIDDFIVSDLVNQRSVAQSLLGGIDRLAGRESCAAIQTTLPAEDGTPTDYRRWLHDELCGQGHHLDTVVMRKALVPVLKSSDRRPPDSGDPSAPTG